jgi:hypothetical protein
MRQKLFNLSIENKKKYKHDNYKNTKRKLKMNKRFLKMPNLLK